MKILSVSSVLDLIFNLPFALDVIIILFLLISTSLGFAKGFWRGTFRFLFVVLFLLIAWFTLVDSFAIFMRDEAFNLFNVKEKLPNGTIVTSFGDLIKGIILEQQAEGNMLPEKFLNPVYVDGFILAFCKTIAWLILVVIIQFGSWLLSSIIYFLLIRWIIPKRVREKRLRLLGALMGLLQGVVVAFALMISFSALSPIVGSINNPGHEYYSWISEYTIVTIKAFNPNNSMMAPYVDSFGKALSDDLFTFTVDGVKYYFIDEAMEFFDITSTYQPEAKIEEEPIQLLNLIINFAAALIS